MDSNQQVQPLQNTPAINQETKSYKWLVNIIGFILVLLPIANSFIFSPCDPKTKNTHYIIDSILSYLAVFFFVIGLILGIYYVIKKQKGTLAMQLIIWSVILIIVIGLLTGSIFCRGVSNGPI